MLKCMTVEVSVKDTDIFKEMVCILKCFLEDPAIPEECKKKYKEKIESIVKVGDTECMPDS